MQICIAGWYYRPRFLDAVKASGYPTFVVQHREGDRRGLPGELYENLGLEFGAYRQYVNNHWDWESDVLFIHDDAEVMDARAFRDIETLNAIGVDQAYIFEDEQNEMINGGAHGRAIWMRGSVLRKIADDFPADMTNQGTNVGLVAQRGILAFHERIKNLTANTAVIAIVPSLRFAHRGRLHTEMFVYRKVNQVPGGMVNVL